MRISNPLITLVLFLASCANANSVNSAEDNATQAHIRNVENNFPAVTKDGKTIKLSLQEWMQAFAIPGASIAVIEDYKVSWVKGYGVLEAGKTNVPVTPKTLFQAASISKPVTSLATLHYVERGRFNLDEDINKYFHSWKLQESDASNKVTLRNLISHTSGVTPGGFTGYGRETPLPDITQILNGEPPANTQPSQRS